MELNRQNMKKIMLLITFTIVLFVGIQHLDKVFGALGFLWGIGFPFVLGGAFAFILNLPMTAIEKRLFPKGQKAARPVSLVLALIFILVILAIVGGVVIPELSTTFVILGKNVEAFLPKVQVWAEEIFRDNPQIIASIENLELNWQKMLESGFKFLQTGAGSVLSSTVNVARTIISGVATFFIAFVFSVYILLQKEKLRGQVCRLMQAFLPEKQMHQIMHVCSLTHRTFSHFISGQCMEAVILGTMFFVVMSILRFPYALLVGVLVAFTALIPIFGAFIGCAVGAFLILMVDPWKALAFIILFLILQQLEGNLIYPHVVGNSVGLPSIWVLAAVTVGGSLMGVIGMLIFIPMVSVFYTLLREWMYQRLEKKKATEKSKKTPA